MAALDTVADGNTSDLYIVPARSGVPERSRRYEMRSRSSGSIDKKDTGDKCAKGQHAVPPRKRALIRKSHFKANGYKSASSNITDTVRV